MTGRGERSQEETVDRQKRRNTLYRQMKATTTWERKARWDVLSSTASRPTSTRV